MSVVAVLSTLVSPIMSAYKAFQDTKKAKASVSGKIKMAKQTGDFNLQMTQAEWELIGKRQEGDGWKDDWVTLVITVPLASIFFAAVASVVLENPIYMQAVTAGIAAVTTLLPNFSTVMEVVVYAAVSIKAIKG